MMTWLPRGTDRSTVGKAVSQIRRPTSALFPPHRTTLFASRIIASLCLCVWTAAPAPAEAFGPTAASKPEKTVAAGFGFQNAESSSITVKVYDAETGEVLSDDTYELDIKEEQPLAGVQPRERVFAGGVGPGANGLSEFTLRVYDAANGRFLWEGRLNLNVSGGSDPDVVRVAAQVRPRATVRMMSETAPLNGQPYFFLRAVNPVTGQLVWSDQFSTETTGGARAERIKRPVADTDEMTLQDIDFRIRMFDDAGRQLLWEDRVAPSLGDEASLSTPGSEASAGVLPGTSVVQGDRPGSGMI